MPNLLTSDPYSMPLPGLSRSSVRVFVLLVFIPLMTDVLAGEAIPLQSIVTPSTVVFKDGHPVTFAVHGFIEFKSLAELFPYIQTQTGRWKTAALSEIPNGRPWDANCCDAESRAGLFRWPTSGRWKRW